MFSKGSSNKGETEKRSLENRVEPVRSFKGGSSATVAPSIISANLRVTGDLDSDGDIQIDGYVEGELPRGELRLTASPASVRAAPPWWLRLSCQKPPREDAGIAKKSGRNS